MRLGLGIAVTAARRLGAVAVVTYRLLTRSANTLTTRSGDRLRWR